MAQRSSDDKMIAAIDVGGTRIKAALVDRDYNLLQVSLTTTPASLAQDFGGFLGAIVQVLLDQAAGGGPARQLRGCGVVVPGLVDDIAGVGALSVNLHWRNLPLGAALQRQLGVPVRIGHDVRAGLIAEHRMGAARGARHALFIAIGTGIAAAVMVDGRVLMADGWAGEIGHVIAESHGRHCACGGRGCLETISSASAIAAAYQRLAGSAATAAEVAALVDAGDPIATQVWAGAVRALGVVIVNAITITGIDCVILGGGLAEAGPTLLEPLAAEISGRLTFQRQPELLLARFGDRAGLLGAACIAWDAA